MVNTMGKLNDQVIEAVAEMKVTGTHECRAYNVHDCILQAVVDTPELSEMEPNDAWLVAMLGLHNFCTIYDENQDRITVHRVSCPDAIKNAASLGYTFIIKPLTPEHLESIRNEQKFFDPVKIKKAMSYEHDDDGPHQFDGVEGPVDEDETQEEDADDGSDLGDQGDDQPSDER